VKYDPTLKASREAWRKDHTLRTAYKDSVRWYYHGVLPAPATR
jgi:beta-lactamase class D